MWAALVLGCNGPHDCRSGAERQFALGSVPVEGPFGVNIPRACLQYFGLRLDAELVARGLGDAMANLSMFDTKVSIRGMTTAYQISYCLP